MKAALWMILVSSVAACSDGGAGSGEDTLPKKGEEMADPTIVSVVARCPPKETQSPSEKQYFSLTIAGSDPAGVANLGTCAVMFNGKSDQDSFGEGQSCYITMEYDCKVGTDYVVDVVVSNATGGVTTASVKVRP